MPEATARPSRWRVFAPDSAGAIYGSIAAMAVIAGTATDPAHGKALGLAIATLFVFWLAHVYAQTLAHHRGGRCGRTGRRCGRPWPRSGRCWRAQSPCWRCWPSGSSACWTSSGPSGWPSGWA